MIYCQRRSFVVPPCLGSWLLQTDGTLAALIRKHLIVLLCGQPKVAFELIRAHFSQPFLALQWRFTF